MGCIGDLVCKLIKFLNYMEIHILKYVILVEQIMSEISKPEIKIIRNFNTKQAEIVRIVEMNCVIQLLILESHFHNKLLLKLKCILVKLIFVFVLVAAYWFNLLCYFHFQYHKKVIQQLLIYNPHHQIWLPLLEFGVKWMM